MQSVLAKAHEEDFTVTGRHVGVRHVDAAKGDARAEAIRLLAVNRVAALIVGPGVKNLDDILAAARAHPTPVIVLDEVVQAPDCARRVPARPRSGAARRGRGALPAARRAS